MWKLLGTIKTNIEIVLPTSMVLGFFTGLGLDAHLLDALIGPLTILMAYPMMIPLRFRDILNGGMEGENNLVAIFSTSVSFFHGGRGDSAVCHRHR